MSWGGGGGGEGGREKSISCRPRNDSTKGTYTQLEIKEGSF